MFFFDMDGTLIDSNRVWKEVDERFLARRGIPYTRAYYEGVAHTILPLAAQFTREFCHLTESCQEIMDEWMEMAKDIYARVTVKPGVRAYLKQCRAEGRPMAVVTSSVPEHCRTALERLDLAKYFDRVTFAAGDSCANPERLGTRGCFCGILKALFHEINRTGRLLNQPGFTIKEAAACLMNLSPHLTTTPGGALDEYIEAHIHGRIILETDVAALYLDDSFRATELECKARELCRRFRIELHFIPERHVKIEEIDDLFRGPAMRPLAEKIDSAFGRNSGVLNARLIGLASCDSVQNPAAWSNSGSEPELFQYFKQLWHTVVHHARQRSLLRS